MRKQPIYPVKKCKRESESPEKGPLTTLAIAAEVSPRHNGDVRTLSAVIRLLQKKAQIIRHIEYYHDQAEEVCICFHFLLIALLIFLFF